MVACVSATTPSVEAPPAAAAMEACPRATALEPQAIAAEASCLLRQYVRIETVNPPGNELQAAKFLRDVLARDGIESQIIESAPGRANLIARLRGTGAGRAVALMHHMDVVPARASEWTVPPFEGVERDGYVWGRGSIDNKGGGVVELMTMLLAKRLATPLPRDLVFLAVADEEAGGGFGARYLTTQRKDLFADVEFVLNEGGAILQLGEGPGIYNVEIAQKAPLWLRVTARGNSGHGSTPYPDTPVHVLVRGLARLTAHQFPIVVLPEVQRLYAAKAQAMPEPVRTAYGDLRAALADAAFRETFLKDAHDAALVRNSFVITMLEGSGKENVIPGEASAVIDLRLLPGQDVEEVTREVSRVLGEPRLEVKALLSWQAHAASEDTALFHAIADVARERGAPIVPSVITGFTDCNAFRAQNITCYGFMPVRVAPKDFELIHGANERVSVKEVATAAADLHALLLRLGAAAK